MLCGMHHLCSLLGAHGVISSDLTMAVVAPVRVTCDGGGRSSTPCTERVSDVHQTIDGIVGGLVCVVGCLCGPESLGSTPSNEGSILDCLVPVSVLVTRVWRMALETL